MSWVIRSRGETRLYIGNTGFVTPLIQEVKEFTLKVTATHYLIRNVERPDDFEVIQKEEQMAQQTLKLPATARHIQEFANGFGGLTLLEYVNGELREQRKIKGYRIGKAAQYGVTEEYFDQCGEWSKSRLDAALFQTHRMAEIVRDAIKPGGNYAIETVYHD